MCKMSLVLKYVCDDANMFHDVIFIDDDNKIC